MKSSFSIDEDDEPVPDMGTLEMEMSGSVNGMDPLKKKTLQLLAGIGGLCVVLTAILVAVAATALLWGTITSNFNDSDLTQQTTEYQLVLHMERFTSNRRNGIEPMLLFFGQKAGINVSWEHGYESVREQQQLHGDLCDAHYSPHVRIRNYMTGPKQGTSTLDLKLDEAISKTLAGLAPYQPNDKQRLTTFDKVEHDVHPCPGSDKYSREVRLKDIPYKPTFSYCSELAELFPYFFSVPMQPYQTVTMTEPDPWYSYVYEGNLLVNGISTPFKLDWTIHYDNFHDALNDGATSDGEMSFRVWALDEGRGPYDPASLAFSDSIYSALLEEFGSNGYKKCDGVPVSEYGELGPLHPPSPSPSPSAFPTPLSFPPDRRANF